jgi:hypothetical protein
MEYDVVVVGAGPAGLSVRSLLSLLILLTLLTLPIPFTPVGYYAHEAADNTLPSFLTGGDPHEAADNTLITLLSFPVGSHPHEAVGNNLLTLITLHLFLQAAIRMKQLAAAADQEISVCVVEKGAEVPIY